MLDTWFYCLMAYLKSNNSLYSLSANCGPVIVSSTPHINSFNHITTLKVSSITILFHRLKKKNRGIESLSIFAKRTATHGTKRGLRQLTQRAQVLTTVHTVFYFPNTNHFHIFFSNLRSRSSLLIMTHVCFISHSKTLSNNPSRCQKTLSGFPFPT